ncbi:MAG: DUF354 domain-containing protein [Candidatus Thermoplasmatota archaeon]|nr:DUF354 domain-containing protein [Candidatus Thermoplasmatota archaeon]
MMNGTVWIDLLNPSHPLFFKPVIDRISKNARLNVTMRDRGETLSIANDLGIKGDAIGKDYENAFLKTSSIAIRTLQLSLHLKRFDTALSFENPMSVAVGWMRRKKTILMLDNDVKYNKGSGRIQKIESWLKTKTDILIVPKCTKHRFKKHFSRSRILTYDGYKEDIYISGHIPNKDILSKLPFKDYIVIRPEALASFYVKEEKSITEILLDRFEKEGINIVFLPRDRSDWNISGRKNVHIPPKPLNGLDLIYYSMGVLTGSGTMAREGAIIGRKAVSFFPGKELLTVDQDLIEKGMMVHSRDVDEIIDHILEKKHINDTHGHDPKKVQIEFFEKLGSALED